MHIKRYALSIGFLVYSLTLVASILSTNANAATYYISPTGSNSNAGASLSAPWQTFRFAIPRLNPGDTLFLLNGTYTDSNSGLPSIDCSSGAHNGTASQPITVKALNERQAHLQGNGTNVLYVYQCSYWVIEGIYSSNIDVAAGGYEGSTFVVHSSDHITLRRNLAYGPNARFNSHAYSILSSTNGLIEENEAYYVHRHGIVLHGPPNPDGTIVRRNYVHSRDHRDMPGGYASDPPGDVRGDTGYSCYPCKNSIFENNIAEDWDAGFDIQAKTDSINNKYFGNIVMRTRFGFLFAARSDSSSGADIMPTNTQLTHNVTMDMDMTGGAATYFRSNKNTHVDNCSFLGGTGYGIAADLGAGGDGNMSVFGTNVLVMNYAQPGFDISRQTTWSFDYVHAIGNGGNYSPALSDSHFTNIRTSNPNLGTCKVFIPQGSPAKGTGVGGADIGANVLYRYQDGVLTNTPLWDPTTSRFPCGAQVAGVNDIVGSSCFDVHTRLNVNTNGCTLPTTITLPAPRNLHLVGSPN